MIIDGKRYKKEIMDELKEKVGSKKIKFVVIQVGQDPSSSIYIEQKKRMADYVGFECEHIKLEEDVTLEYLLNKISILNNDKTVNGIMVQLPLPDNLPEKIVINAIDPDKDIDGLTDINIGRLCHDRKGLYSCTPYGVMEILRRNNIPLKGRCAVVVGRSNLVGKPMSLFLINSGATVIVCNSSTKDLSSYTKMADILIVAAGKPNLITGDMVKEGVVLIDVGINRIDNLICGDASFESVSKKASYITPVPGGVGPMTVAMLGVNILSAYYLQQDKYN